MVSGFESLPPSQSRPAGPSLPWMTPRPEEKLLPMAAPDEMIAQARSQLRYFLREGRRPDDARAAIRIWKRLIPLMPDSAEPAGAIAELYVELGLLPEAKAFFLSAAENCASRGDHFHAELALRRVVDFDPTDLKTRARLADACERQGRSSAAVEQHLAIGHRLSTMGHRREAVEVLELGIRKWPADPELRRQREGLAVDALPALPDAHMTLRHFQLVEIFEEEALEAVLDRPEWAVRHPGFARQWGSDEPLVWSGVIVPAEILRVLVRECPCRLHLWADRDGVTLHLGGAERPPFRVHRDAAGGDVMKPLADAIKLTTESAFEVYGADAVWLALEYGRSRKGEMDLRFRETSRTLP